MRLGCKDDPIHLEAMNRVHCIAQVRHISIASFLLFTPQKTILLWIMALPLSSLTTYAPPPTLFMLDQERAILHLTHCFGGRTYLLSFVLVSVPFSSSTLLETFVTRTTHPLPPKLSPWYHADWNISLQRKHCSYFLRDATRSMGNIF